MSSGTEKTMASKSINYFYDLKSIKKEVYCFKYHLEYFGKRLCRKWADKKTIYQTKALKLEIKIKPFISLRFIYLSFKKTIIIK